MSDEIKIVKNIQPPEGRAFGRGHARRYKPLPFEDLDIGDGFIVPMEDAGWRENKCHSGREAGAMKKANRVMNAASSIGKRLGRRFTCVADDDGNVHVKRVE